MISDPSKDGYAIARTSSPPVAYFNTPQDRSRRASASGSLASANGPDGYVTGNHSATHSGASYEPLMASYYRQSSGSGQLPNSPAAATPPAAAASSQAPPASSSQEPPPLVDDRDPTEAHSMFTTDMTDDRLDPGLRQRQREAESASMRDLKDEEDYSRPVLGVRTKLLIWGLVLTNSKCRFGIYLEIRLCKAGPASLGYELLHDSPKITPRPKSISHLYMPYSTFATDFLFFIEHSTECKWKEISFHEESFFLSQDIFHTRTCFSFPSHGLLSRLLSTRLVLCTQSHIHIYIHMYTCFPAVFYSFSILQTPLH